jgi:hypothetical protein
VSEWKSGSCWGPSVIITSRGVTFWRGENETGVRKCLSGRGLWPLFFFRRARPVGRVRDRRMGAAHRAVHSTLTRSVARIGEAR